MFFVQLIWQQHIFKRDKEISYELQTRVGPGDVGFDGLDESLAKFVQGKQLSSKVDQIGLVRLSITHAQFEGLATELFVSQHLLAQLDEVVFKLLRKWLEKSFLESFLGHQNFSQEADVSIIKVVPDHLYNSQLELGIGKLTTKLQLAREDFENIVDAV